MLRSVSAIKGHAVDASDGRIGTVADFLFDDASWRVRWAIVSIGAWPLTRKALIPVSALGPLEAPNHELSVRLTMQQIREGPGIDTDRPVSRQMETQVFDHYGSPPYWGAGLDFGAYGYGAGLLASPFLGTPFEERAAIEAQRSHDDPHLRSVEVVIGYHIQATDGEIGHLEDVLVDDTTWTIQSLLVDTKNWWRGKRVLISPGLVKGFDWHDKLVNIGADRHTLAASPPYNPPAPLDPFDDSTLEVPQTNRKPPDRP